MAIKHRQRAVHTIKQQPRIKGLIRVPLTAGVRGAIRRAVRREARAFGVSGSFVIAVAVAWALGVELDGHETYKPHPRRFRVIEGGRQRKIG